MNANPASIESVIASATHCMECEGTGEVAEGWTADWTQRLGPCPICTKVADAVRAWLMGGAS
jgi:hypothetical protein